MPASPTHVGRTARPVRIVAIALTLAAVAVILLPAAVADTLKVQGSTTFATGLMNPHREAIERLAGHELDVLPNKSSHGLIALLKGEVDLAMISMPLAGEIVALREQRPELPVDRLRGFEIARTRVAFAVHPSNPVRSLPVDTLRRVLLGEIKSWREVGGADRPIITVTVRDGGGVPATVRSTVLAGAELMPAQLTTVLAPRMVVAIAEQQPEALGLAQLQLLSGRRAAELKTDRPIEQVLSLVTLGPPEPRLLAVIHAVRLVAAERLF